MDRKEVEYLQRLLEIFKVEAQEHINTMANGLLELEKAKAEDRSPWVEVIYREAHSLKGAARAVNMAEIEGLCQRLESVFSEMKRPEAMAKVSSALFDALHRAVSDLDAMLQGPHTGRSVAETARTQELYRDLETSALGAFSNVASDATPGAGSASAKSQLQSGAAPSRVSPASRRRPAGRAAPVVQKPVHTQERTSAHGAAQPEPTGSASATATATPVAPNVPVASAEISSEATTAPDKPALRKHPPAQAILDDRSADTIRVSTAKLDALLLQAEELLSAKLTSGYRAAELRELTVAIAGWSKEWSKVRSDVRAMQQSVERDEGDQPAPQRTGSNGVVLRSLLEFLEWNQSFVKSVENRVAALSKASEHDQSALAGMTDTLLEDMKQVLMLPFASLLETFPRMARDISRSRGKNVSLIIRGGEIEIDRRILEALKDPLIHLVRNSIDHGIEAAEERARLGKPESGTVTIAVAQKDAKKIEVLVSDDGAGINAQQVLASAIKSGLASESEADKFDEAAALSLIFHSGFSTSQMITDLSGRGLGLAIVREKVEKLGGTVSVEVEPGAGTSFRLVLPLTLATCRGILVQVGTSSSAENDATDAGGRLFVLPTTHVERVVGVQSSEIKSVGGRETIMLDGETVSLARLGDSLGLADGDSRAEADGVAPAVVLNAGDKRIAFLVEEVLDEQEVLVKSLGPQLLRVRNISGATVLGSGKVVPILNVVDLLKSTARKEHIGGPARPSKEVAASEVESKRKSILVAEDSITSRTLFKNILEAAGYSVKTAIDGADALTELLTTRYDLLVSDIEMPRMNGFDLVAKVRDDQNLMDLPVVLVTSLESREDRERGAEVGANAYLVKRGFDQANLLEVIRRLI